MNDKLATYSFLPWLRKGIANQIQSADLDTGVQLRASIPINLKVEGDGVEGGTISDTISRSISLYGPGDIVGIDPDTIIKTEPLNQITNFEPNYLACIDFYEEDLPWRYTPAKPDAKGRLRPWMTLVVLKESEFENGITSDRPLPYINLLETTANVFPKPEQLWAWAHVHVNRDLVQNDIQTTSETGLPYIEKVRSEIDENIISEFENTLNQNPDLAYARVMCPRKLEENEGYHAFLIPTFESGRLAGLGLNVEEEFDAAGGAIHATFSAWGDYAGRKESTNYPVYHRWYFRTGAIGDFEYLVRLLEPQPMDSRVGRRDLDVTAPGSNLSGITDNDENGQPVPQLDGVLKLGGALRIPVDTLPDDEKAEVEKYDGWDQPYPRTFQKELAAFVNLADNFKKDTAANALQDPDLPEAIRDEAALEDDPDPLITAPLYGQWHALTQRLLDPTDGKPDDNWVHELNLDPRFRVAAAYGTKIVQTNQEKYMESAWEQVGDVLAANRKIYLAQLAQQASKQWYATCFKPISTAKTSTFMWLTQPMQFKVLSMGLTLEKTTELQTVYHQVKDSRVPAVMLSPSMRKLTRPNARLSKRLQLHSSELDFDTIIERVNEGEIVPAPPKTPPTDVPSVDGLADEILEQGAGGLTGHLLKWRHLETLLWILGITGLILLVLGILGHWTSIFLGLGGVLLLITFMLIIQRRRQQIREEQVEILRPDNQSPEAINELPQFPEFELSLPGHSVDLDTGSFDSPEAIRFKDAMIDVSIIMQESQTLSYRPDPIPLDIQAINTATITAIDPLVTIPNWVYAGVIIPPHIWQDLLTETFKPVMAYPELELPMYKPLIDVSADLFLPNINFIPENSISLLETNQEFIESYMVGLNHEFARELLWREYPTDQRGSYFRQFWDVSSFYDPDATDVEAQKEKLKDIPKLHLWSKFSKLGDHDHREEGGDNEQEVVLVIRGELLKRYPNAVIYAHRARWKAKEGTTNEPDRGQERELAPIPSGTEDNPSRDLIKTPLYEAKADPDIYFLGFDLTATEVRGMVDGEPADLDDDAGWFFVIKERPGEPRFGLDIGTTADGELEVWNDMSWGNATPAVPDGGFLQIATDTVTIDVGANDLEPDDDEKKAQREEDVQLTWNKDMNSSELAYVLFQAPVMVAVHGAEMLPESN